MIKTVLFAGLIMVVVISFSLYATSYAKKGDKKRTCSTVQNKMRLDLQSGDQKLENEKTRAVLNVSTTEYNYKTKKRDFPKNIKKELEQKLEEISGYVEGVKKATKNVNCSDLEKSKKEFVKRADRTAKAIVLLEEVSDSLEVLNEDLIVKGSSSDDKEKDKMGNKDDKKAKRESRVKDQLERIIENLKTQANLKDADLVDIEEDATIAPTSSPASSPAASPGI